MAGAVLEEVEDKVIGTFCKVESLPAVLYSIVRLLSECYLVAVPSYCVCGHDKYEVV